MRLSKIEKGIGLLSNLIDVLLNKYGYQTCFDEQKLFVFKHYFFYCKKHLRSQKCS